MDVQTVDVRLRSLSPPGARGAALDGCGFEERGEGWGEGRGSPHCFILQPSLLPTPACRYQAHRRKAKEKAARSRGRLSAKPAQTLEGVLHAQVDAVVLLAVVAEPAAVAQPAAQCLVELRAHADVAGAPGLVGRELIVTLDGTEIDRITTGENGNFELEHNLGYLISRGGHDIKFSFEGQSFYLPVEYNMTVYAWANIILHDAVLA